MDYEKSLIVSYATSVTLLLEFFAFLRLKYTEADTPRPFEVPFGRKGAWAITVPKILVLVGVLLAQKAHIWLFCGIFNLILVILYLFWSHYQVKERAMIAEAKKKHANPIRVVENYGATTKFS